MVLMAIACKEIVRCLHSRSHHLKKEFGEAVFFFFCARTPQRWQSRLGLTKHMYLRNDKKLP